MREAPKLNVDCFKYRCGRTAVTVEAETGPGAESFPSALCSDHARCPHKKGTFETPTVVRASR